MEKLEYVKPSAEVIRFENEDIITTSGGCGELSDRGIECGNIYGQW